MIKIIQGDITTLAVDAIVNAVQIAVREVREFLSHAEARRGGEEEMEVVFCCFSERNKQVYERIVFQKGY